MTKLILIRHGETDWNTEGRWQGQVDLPLNARGQGQAEQIASCLSDSEISAIYSSDLRRAVETAEALGKLTGLPVRTDPRLREIHQGKWQGLLVREIKECYAEAFQRRHENPLSVAPPGGETAQDVHERVIHAIEQILEEHPEETVAIVSHGFAIAVTLAHYKKVPFEKVWDLVPRNASIHTLEVLQ
ncbi:MAG TPA: histidine phosphatase family protein [Anaerolineales bacterium]|nr:histidine phosphatase family protein [Anaerolineales bacterium]